MKNMSELPQSAKAKENLRKNTELQAGEKRILEFNPEKIEPIEVNFNGRYIKCNGCEKIVAGTEAKYLERLCVMGGFPGGGIVAGIMPMCKDCYYIEDGILSALLKV